jgi:hypothetical protein
VARRAVVGCLLTGLSSLTTATGDHWMVEDGAALELLLAHEERSAPDVGVLRVDPLQRTVVWEGLGPQACQHRIAAGFADVKSVRKRRAGGFVMELGGASTRSLALIPLPHAEWLGGQYAIDPGRMETLFATSDIFVGRNSSRSAGRPGATSAPSFRRKDPTAQVVADTGRAVDRILELLGRPPTPLVVLREAVYGRPVDVSAADILAAPAQYEGRAIRLHGRVEPLESGGYRLTEEGSAVAVLPETSIAALVRVDAPGWGAAEIEVTGILERRDGMPAVRFWEYVGPQGGARAVTGKGLTLEALAADAKASEGQVVRVIGKFRGRNLYGDLPMSSRRRDSDWVIKDGRWAVWVTGREPAGDGWRLDPRVPADTSQWVEVVGRPQSRKGVTALRALDVRPVPPPPGAHVLPAKQLSIARDAAPAVVFVLPLEGEPISPDTRFVLQFSKYMNEESFAGRVRLFDASGPAAAARESTPRLRYDETLRALIVEPEAALEPGSSAEIRLLPGILDVNGLALVPRAPGVASDAVEVLRYLVSP